MSEKKALMLTQDEALELADIVSSLCMEYGTCKSDDDPSTLIGRVRFFPKEWNPDYKP